MTAIGLPSHLVALFYVLCYFLFCCCYRPQFEIRGKKNKIEGPLVMDPRSPSCCHFD